MDPENRVNSPGLHKQLLLARCELDRLELAAGFKGMRDRVRGQVDDVRRVTPWLVVAAPLLGLLAGRLFRWRRLGTLLVVAQAALQLRRWWPLVADLLRARNAPAAGASGAAASGPK
jgi:hypothetical protein